MWNKSWTCTYLMHTLEKKNEARKRPHECWVLLRRIQSLKKEKRRKKRREEKDQILHHLTRMRLVCVLSSHFIIFIRIHDTYYTTQISVSEVFSLYSYLPYFKFFFVAISDTIKSCQITKTMRTKWWVV